MADQLPDDHYRPTYEEIHVNIQATASDIQSRFDPDLMVAIAGGGLFPGRVLRTYLKKPSSLDPTRLRNIPLQAIGLSLYEETAGTNVGSIGKHVIRTQWLDGASIRGRRQQQQQQVVGAHGGAKSAPHDQGTGMDHARSPTTTNDTTAPTAAAAAAATAAGLAAVDPPPKIEEGKDAGGLLGKRILIVDEVDDSRTTLEYAYAELLSDVRHALSSLSPHERAQLPPTRFGIFVVNNKERPKRGRLPIYPPHVSLRDEPLSEDGCLGSGCYYWSAQDTGDVWVEYPWEQTNILEHNRLAALARKLGVNQPKPKPSTSTSTAVAGAAEVEAAKAA